MIRSFHSKETEALFADMEVPRFRAFERIAHKKLLDPIHPGEILFEEFMKPMGISINRLARDIAVPPGRISAIVNGPRAITADSALRLGQYFGVSAELWLGLQADFDLRIARRMVGARIDKQVHARVA